GGGGGWLLRHLASGSRADYGSGDSRRSIRQCPRCGQGPETVTRSLDAPIGIGRIQETRMKLPHEPSREQALDIARSQDDHSFSKGKKRPPQPFVRNKPWPPKPQPPRRGRKFA